MEMVFNEDESSLSMVYKQEPAPNTTETAIDQRISFDYKREISKCGDNDPEYVPPLGAVVSLNRNRNETLPSERSRRRVSKPKTYEEFVHDFKDDECSTENGSTSNEQSFPAHPKLSFNYRQTYQVYGASKRIKKNFDNGGANNDEKYRNDVYNDNSINTANINVKSSDKTAELTTALIADLAAITNNFSIGIASSSAYIENLIPSKTRNGADLVSNRNTIVTVTSAVTTSNVSDSVVTRNNNSPNVTNDNSSNVIETNDCCNNMNNNNNDNRSPSVSRTTVTTTDDVARYGDNLDAGILSDLYREYLKRKDNLVDNKDADFRQLENVVFTSFSTIDILDDFTKYSDSVLSFKRLPVRENGRRANSNNSNISTSSSDCSKYVTIRNKSKPNINGNEKTWTNLLPSREKKFHSVVVNEKCSKTSKSIKVDRATMTSPVSRLKIRTDILINSSNDPDIRSFNNSVNLLSSYNDKDSFKQDVSISDDDKGLLSSSSKIEFAEENSSIAISTIEQFENSTANVTRLKESEISTTLSDNNDKSSANLLTAPNNTNSNSYDSSVSDEFHNRTVSGPTCRDSIGNVIKSEIITHLRNTTNDGGDNSWCDSIRKSHSYNDRSEDESCDNYPYRVNLDELNSIYHREMRNNRPNSFLIMYLGVDRPLYPEVFQNVILSKTYVENHSNIDDTLITELWANFAVSTIVSLRDDNSSSVIRSDSVIQMLVPIIHSSLKTKSITDVRGDRLYLRSSNTNSSRFGSCNQTPTDKNDKKIENIIDENLSSSNDKIFFSHKRHCSRTCGVFFNYNARNRTNVYKYVLSNRLNEEKNRFWYGSTLYTRISEEEELNERLSVVGNSLDDKNKLNNKKQMKINKWCNSASSLISLSESFDDILRTNRTINADLINRDNMVEQQSIPMTMSDSDVRWIVFDVDNQFSSIVFNDHREKIRRSELLEILVKAESSKKVYRRRTDYCSSKYSHKYRFPFGAYAFPGLCKLIVIGPFDSYERHYMSAVYEYDNINNNNSNNNDKTLFIRFRTVNPGDQESVFNMHEKRRPKWIRSTIDFVWWTPFKPKRTASINNLYLNSFFKLIDGQPDNKNTTIARVYDDVDSLPFERTGRKVETEEKFDDGHRVEFRPTVNSTDSTASFVANQCVNFDNNRFANQLTDVNDTDNMNITDRTTKHKPKQNSLSGQKMLEINTSVCVKEESIYDEGNETCGNSSSMVAERSLSLSPSVREKKYEFKKKLHQTDSRKRKNSFNASYIDSFDNNTSFVKSKKPRKQMDESTDEIDTITEQKRKKMDEAKRFKKTENDSKGSKRTSNFSTYDDETSTNNSIDDYGRNKRKRQCPKRLKDFLDVYVLDEYLLNEEDDGNEDAPTVDGNKKKGRNTTVTTTFKEEKSSPIKKSLTSPERITDRTNVENKKMPLISTRDMTANVTVATSSMTTVSRSKIDTTRISDCYDDREENFDKANKMSYCSMVNYGQEDDKKKNIKISTIDDSTSAVDNSITTAASATTNSVCIKIEKDDEKTNEKLMLPEKKITQQRQNESATTVRKYSTSTEVNTNKKKSLPLTFGQKFLYTNNNNDNDNNRNNNNNIRSLFLRRKDNSFRKETGVMKETQHDVTKKKVQKTPLEKSESKLYLLLGGNSAITDYISSPDSNRSFPAASNNVIDRNTRKLDKFNRRLEKAHSTIKLQTVRAMNFKEIQRRLSLHAFRHDHNYLDFDYNARKSFNTTNTINSNNININNNNNNNTSYDCSRKTYSSDITNDNANKKNLSSSAATVFRSKVKIATKSIETATNNFRRLMLKKRLSLPIDDNVIEIPDDDAPVKENNSKLVIDLEPEVSSDDDSVNLRKFTNSRSVSSSVKIVDNGSINTTGTSRSTGDSFTTTAVKRNITTAAVPDNKRSSLSAIFGYCSVVNPYFKDNNKMSSLQPTVEDSDSTEECSPLISFYKKLNIL